MIFLISYANSVNEENAYLIFSPYLSSHSYFLLLISALVHSTFDETTVIEGLRILDFNFLRPGALFCSQDRQQKILLPPLILAKYSSESLLFSRFN